ncbi:ABC transporter ATP-binding protein [bacterium]|nr:ABC transporter ATP-binding protein [bacterium]
MEKLKILMGILDRWKSYYVLSAVLLILSTGIRMLEPKILQIAVDGVVVFAQSNGKELHISNDFVTQFFYKILPEMKLENISVILIYLGALYLIVSFFRAGFMFASSTITYDSSQKAIKKLRDKLFNHIQYLPLVYHTKIPTGELIQRCTGDIETIKNFIAAHLVDILRLSVLFVGAFLMMAAVNLKFALVAIVISPVLGFISYSFFKKEKIIWDEHEKEQDKLAVIVQENISGIRVVKAFAKENFEINKFANQNLRKKNIGIRQANMNASFWSTTDILINTQLTIVVLYGTYLVFKSEISVGELVSFFSYAHLVTWPMRRLAEIITKMGMTNVALKRLTSILHEETEATHGHENDGKSLKGTLEFRDVYFRYKKDDENHVLNGVSFKIQQGEKVALLGPTGSGKSTIIALLTRLYDVQQGEILIDGKNINTFSKDYLRKRIGVVLQKPFLFSNSIKENIAYAKPDSLHEDIIESAKAAKIHEIIEIFPNGYETVVGEKGVTLSGGQKQRVTIARTLLANPDILVLDDSTSAVDTETEFEIQAALRETMKDKTSIVIAHRITSVCDADRIIVLEKGKVIENGTHEKLIANNGFYKRIYEIQVSIEEEIKKEEF